VDEVDVFLSFVAELQHASGGRSGSLRNVFGVADTALKARFLDLLADPDRRVIFAVDDATDAPLGMAVLSRDEISALAGTPVINLSHMVVAPEQAHRGAARALIGASAEHAEEMGCEHVIVGISSGGRETHRFFARLGFAPLTSRRIASIGALRRTLGVPEHADGGYRRRRVLRPERVLTRPIPMSQRRARNSGTGAA